MIITSSKYLSDHTSNYSIVTSCIINTNRTSRIMYGFKIIHEFPGKPIHGTDKSYLSEL